MNQSPLLRLEPGKSVAPDHSPAGPVRRILVLALARTDWLQIVPAVMLLATGALFIYGTGQQTGGFAAVTFWKRHLLYMAIGSAVWLLLSALDYRWCGPAAAAFYPVTVLLLIIVLFFGKKYFGSDRWLEFGPLNFQPSELAKFALLVLTAWLLSLKNADVNRPLWLGAILFLLAAPAFLTMLQPDLGTALTMAVPVAAIMFAARIKWRIILIILTASAAMAFAGYNYGLKDYQKERIRVFLDPGRDPQRRGWHQLQAEIAVGSGGVAGKGFMNGSHNLLGYLPRKVANSDFIFPVIAEETGFLGALGVVLLCMVLIFSVFRTALLAPDAFGCYLCVGIAILLFFHVYVNIAMSIRLCPITGLPLPLVSYGGTFLVTVMAYLGIVHSVYAHRMRKSIFDL